MVTISKELIRILKRMNRHEGSLKKGMEGHWKEESDKKNKKSHNCGALEAYAVISEFFIYFLNK